MYQLYIKQQLVQFILLLIMHIGTDVVCVVF